MPPGHELLSLPDGRELPAPGTLPSGSRVPFPRDPRFVARTEILRTLADRLLYGPPRPVALVAPHGTGKTATAVEFVYRYGRFTPGVYWLNAAAATPDGKMAALDDQVAAAGLAMSPADWPATQRAQVAWTLDRWTQQGTHLLIVDNVAHEQTARQWLSRLAGLRVLFLTSGLDLPGEMDLDVLHLPPLDAAAEAALIDAALAPRRLTASETATLSVRLAHLPWTESLAGRCLARDPARSPDAYLADLGDRPPSVAVPRASWNLLSSTQARRLLLAAAYALPDEPIPRPLLRRTVELAGDEVGVDRALDELLSLRLLQPAQGTADVMIPSNTARWIAAAPPDPLAAPLLLCWAQALVELARTANEGDSSAHFLPLRLHIQAVLLWLERSGRFQDVAAALWNNLGSHWLAVAEYERAREAFARARALDEAIYGPDHANVAVDAEHLGRALYGLGDLDGAQRAYERAVAVGEAFFGPRHPALSAALGGLGQVLYSAGHLLPALSLFERALAIDEACYEARHPVVARDAALLGQVLHDLGDLEGAHQALERALGGWDGTRSDRATLTSSLGEVLYDMGDLDDAREAFSRALSLTRSRQGADDLNVARDLNNMGIALHAHGDLVGARWALERARQILHAAPEMDSVFVAAVLNNLGGVLQEMGDLEAARTAFEQAVAVDTAAYGSQHPAVAVHASNLARVLSEMGDLEGARVQYELALSLLERFRGPDHLEVGILSNELGDVLRRLGDADAAQQAFHRALSILRILPRRHPQRRFAQRSLYALRRA